MTKESSKKSIQAEQTEFTEKVVEVNRTSKKTKGGNRLSFSALVVVGDQKGRVGYGLGKASELSFAIEKAKRRARNSLMDVLIVREAKTLPHPVRLKQKAVKILLKPAPAGTGLRVGGPMRAVLEVAGYKNVVGKILGSNNKKGNVDATLEALKRLRKESRK